MPSEEPPADTTTRRTAPKRKREKLPARNGTSSSNTPNAPSAYARRSPPRETATPPEDGGDSPPRKLKRPGGGSRIAAANREAAERERKQREEEARKELAGRQGAGADIIAEHYNAVPERGRDWRRTESKITGLRSLNNWIKSTLSQKFSRPEIPVQDMKVLDLACGKGGDLGKWKKAPQVPVLYVGCDIAKVSIEQASNRYEEDLAKSRGRARMHAEFYVHDTFAQSMIDIPVIRNVGFNPNTGPGGGPIQGGMMQGGFDVVSIMFALHYSYESEVLARGMLSNVAGSLKKGGRFIGVMPNSDVIVQHVKEALGSTTPKAGDSEEKLGETNGNSDDDDDWDPEIPSQQTNGVAEEDNDDWDPEKPSEEQPNTNSEEKVISPTVEIENDLEWGNSLYSVRVSKHQIPREGVFRPPFGWKYHYHLEEAVEAPEYVVPWEAFRALAEDYGLELMYRKGFREVFEDESTDRDLGMLAERMGVLDRDRSKPNGGLKVSEEEMEAASFYHAFCFYKT